MTNDEKAILARQLMVLFEQLAIARDALEEIAAAGGSADAQILAIRALERIEKARRS